VVGATTWLIATVPVVAMAGRVSLLDALRLDARSASASRGSARFRRLLTAAEVAFATVLLIGAILAAQTYRQLLGVDRGFDSAAARPTASSPTTESWASRRATTTRSSRNSSRRSGCRSSPAAPRDPTNPRRWSSASRSPNGSGQVSARSAGASGRAPRRSTTLRAE
jgi:hypothetical protein